MENVKEELPDSCSSASSSSSTEESRLNLENFLEYGIRPKITKRVSRMLAKFNKDLSKSSNLPINTKEFLYWGTCPTCCNTFYGIALGENRAEINVECNSCGGIISGVTNPFKRYWR